MTYSELIEQKQEIAKARAQLDKQKQELDKQEQTINAKLEKAKFSQAEKLLKEICDKTREIEEMGFHVINNDYGDWVDADALDLDWEDNSLTL